MESVSPPQDSDFAQDIFLRTQHSPPPREIMIKRQSLDNNLSLSLLADRSSAELTKSHTMTLDPPRLKKKSTINFSDYKFIEANELMEESHEVSQEGKDTFQLSNVLDEMVESPIQLQVVNLSLVDDLNAYVLFDLEATDPSGSYKVQRRYRDFFSLRQILSKNWPGLFIPPIPPKKAVGNLDLDFVHQRQCYLNVFCYQIAQNPILYNS